MNNNSSSNKSDKWGYIFVPIANAIIVLGKLGIFAFLAYHFNNIWIILLSLFFGGTMTLTYNKEDKREDEKNEQIIFNDAELQAQEKVPGLKDN